MAPRNHRKELEDQWRQRVDNARAVYFRANAQHKRMVEELGHGQIQPADGSFAVASARRAEAWALSEFTRTMRVYSDLVVNGIIPPSDDDQKLIG